MDMQTSFEEKLEVLREENDAIKARLDGQKNESDRKRSPEWRKKAFRNLYA